VETSPQLAQAIVSANADALIAVDASGTITAWNPAAERLLGHTSAEAIGQTLALIIPPPSRPLHISGFHRAMETSETDTRGAPVTAVATHANGTEMEIELTIGIISDGTQSAIAAVAALRPSGHRRPLESYAPNTADR
jgi:PAS domain S-box-containing protein